MADFKPPIDNTLVVALTKLLYPLKMRAQRLTIRVDPQASSVFQKLKGKRTVLLSNHPDAQDPYSIFGLSRSVAEDFYYLAARDVFGVDSAFDAWFGQNVGCYSIDRSLEVDIEAIKMTIRLLKANKRKIVIFPEGDLTGKDHEFASLKPGTVHLLLEAQARVAPDAIFVLPIGVHYKILDKPAMTRAIMKLELRLGVKFHAAISEQDRLYKLMDMVIRRIEAELQIHNKKPSRAGSSAENSSTKESLANDLLALSNRAYAAGQVMVEQIAQEVGVDFINADPLNLLYNLRASHLKDGTSKKINLDMLKSLRRAERLLFVSRLVKGKSSSQDLSQSLYRILQFLYFEIEGKPLQVKREASVSIGNPLNILDFLEEYRSHKEEGISSATKSITRALKQTVTTRENKLAA